LLITRNLKELGSIGIFLQLEDCIMLSRAARTAQPFANIAQLQRARISTETNELITSGFVTLGAVTFGGLVGCGLAEAALRLSAPRK
jgi:hypothetical protein